MYMCTYIDIGICIYIYVYVCIRMKIQADIQIYVCIHMKTLICIHTHTPTYKLIIHTHMHDIPANSAKRVTPLCNQLRLRVC